MKFEQKLVNLAGGLELDVALGEVQRMLELLTIGTTPKQAAAPPAPAPETDVPKTRTSP